MKIFTVSLIKYNAPNGLRLIRGFKSEDARHEWLYKVDLYNQEMTNSLPATGNPPNPLSYVFDEVTVQE